MKTSIITIVYILLFILGCGSGELTKSNKIYSMEDVVTAGFKMKKDFTTEFPEVIDAKSGFFGGREIAIFRYLSVEAADTIGRTAGVEQTKKIEVVEKNIAYGSKVERTMCRGDRGATRGQVASGLRLNLRENSKFENTLIINKLKLFETESFPSTNNNLRNCPRREPLFLEFIIHGNLVILAEPMPGDDSEAIIKYLEDAASNLP